MKKYRDNTIIEQIVMQDICSVQSNNSILPLSLIMCTGTDGTIGINYRDERGNQKCKLPWSHKEDIIFFRNITSTVAYNNQINIIVFGVKTAFSFPKSAINKFPTRKFVIVAEQNHGSTGNSILADLDNYYGPNNYHLITVDDSYDYANFVMNLENYAFDNNLHIHKIFIAGGLKIYNKMFNYCSEYYIGEINDIVTINNETIDVGNNFVVKFDTSLIAKYLTHVATIIDNTCEKIKYVMKKYIPDSHHPENKFLNLAKKILISGNFRDSERTGNGTISLFGETLSIDISDNYCPLMHTRTTPAKMIVGECLWYYSGSTDVDTLRKITDRKKTVWDGNTSREFLDAKGLNYPEGDIGPSYGFQMRHSGATYIDKNADYTNKGIDQISYVIDNIMNIPESRYHIVELWNPKDISTMALPPCLRGYQFYIRKQVITGNFNSHVENVDVLDCIGIQRSSDLFLAGYWNIYQVCYFIYYIIHELEKRGKKLHPGKITMMYGDQHIYNNAISQIREQISLAAKNKLVYYTVDNFDVSIGFTPAQKYEPLSKLTAKMNI